MLAEPPAGRDVSAVRAWSGGPPACITGDIFYMIEPSARDWTHMTALGRRGWIQIVRFCFFFGMNYSGMGVPALPPVRYPPLCPNSIKVFHPNSACD